MTPLQRLMALFEGNDTHYGTHGVPYRDPTGESLKWVIKKTAKTLNGPTTDAMWEAHIAGKKPLGVVPIRQDNATIWGSIDYDVYGQDLTDLIAKVESMKLPLMPARSKSGGLHLFFFTTEPVPAATVQDLLRNLAAALGIAGSEIFPKQTTLLTDRGDQGSWIIMPYFGGTYDGKLERQVGLRRNGSEIGLPEFVRIAEKLRQTPSQIDELSTRHLRAAPGQAIAKDGKRGKRRAVKGKDDPSVPFGDGPPCLFHMVTAGKIGQGGQNNTLFHMGVYFKKKFPDTWPEELHRANALYFEPLHPEDQVDTIIKSLKKKDYEYKCKDEPMRSHCDSILCRRRTHGVTGGGVMAPTITSIKKLNSDPPVWFVEVEGHKIECSTEDLQIWQRFQRLLMNVLHDPFGIIPQAAWLEIIQEAMGKKTEVIEVSEDVRRGGEFMELLETYLTNRQAGEKEDDLLGGRPWLDQETGRYYVIMTNLRKFLEREGMKLPTAQITTRLRELNGVGDKETVHEIRDIKGHPKKVHWIRAELVRHTPKVSTPPLRERPI